MKIPIDPASLSPLIAGLYSLWSRSLRYEVHGEDWEAILKAKDAGQPFILALWHGEIFPMTSWGVGRYTHFVTFVSQSKDGEVIARVLERLGHTTVRGSSSRGGVKALIKAKRIMEKENRMGVFTVDGPKGPRHKVKDGIIFLAQRMGAKIIPMRAFPEKKKVFDKSWDHFVVPYPFTRCQFHIGKPMGITAEKLDENVMKREKERLEKRLLEIKPE